MPFYTKKGMEEVIEIHYRRFFQALGNVYAAFELESDARFEAVELPTSENHHNVQISNEISGSSFSSPLQPTKQTKNSEGPSEQCVIDNSGGSLGNQN